MADSSASAKTAALLINLGTPDDPTTPAVRRYLAEFLSDPRVIDYPRWLWLPILYGAILRIRPKVGARLFPVWTPQGSPLLVQSRALTEKVGKACADLGIRVELAMRYGNPSIAWFSSSSTADGVRRVDRAAVVSTIFGDIDRHVRSTAFTPRSGECGMCRSCARFPTITPRRPTSMRSRAASARSGKPTDARIDCSFVPRHSGALLRLGDPYAEQCRETAALLRDRLGMTESEMILTFQSRVGREKWLTPYTDITLRELPKQGVKRLQVMCPGFAVDCLETLEEIAIRGKEEPVGRRRAFRTTFPPSTTTMRMWR